MTEQQKHIIDQLNDIEFHDLPVAGFSFLTDESEENIVKIDYFLFNEIVKDYDEHSLIFSQIETSKIGNFVFSNKSELEIFELNFKLENDLFSCEILFLTGSGLPSITFNVKCGMISIIQNMHANS